MITGRECSTFKIENIQKLLKMIDINLHKKYKKTELCLLLELILREKHYKTKENYFKEE